MEYRQFGQTDLRVSVIGFGCWEISGTYGPIDETQFSRAVHRAIDGGINCFDTAEAYGMGVSERALAKALGARRNDVTVVTKSGVGYPDAPNRRDSTRRRLTAALDNSLRNLGTDRVDVYLVHWPDINTPFAKLGCRVALIRPNDAMGNYPLQPKYEPVWKALEDTGLIYGMHPFPAGGALKPPGYTEQHSGAELVRRTVASSGVPHSFLSNAQNFQAEAALWVTSVLMSGFFERHPKINAAVFEASSTWLSFLLDECDKAARLYKNERQLPPLQQLPSETFFQHCMTGFEGDEAPPPRFPEFYGDILIWSSDVYHHESSRVIPLLHHYPVRTDTDALWAEGRVMLGFDAEERLIRKLPHDFAERIVWGSRYPHHDTTSAWDAIATLRGGGVPDELIARMMGGNAAEQFGVALTERVAS